MLKLHQPLGLNTSSTNHSPKFIKFRNHGAPVAAFGCNVYELVTVSYVNRTGGSCVCDGFPPFARA
jgi:hypothetical protein